MRSKFQNKIKGAIIKIIWLGAIIGCVAFTGCEKASEERVDLYEYMKFLDYTDENADGVKPAENQTIVVVEGDVSEYRGIVVEDKPYVDIDAIQKYVDERFYWDSIENYVMYTDVSNIYSANVGESGCYLNGKEEKLGYVVSYTENDVCYVSMEFVDKFADVDYKLYKGSDDEPARICLLYSSGEYIEAKADKDNELRVSADLMSAIVVDISKGEKVIVLEEGKEWSKVQTTDGYIGYIREKYFKNKTTKTIERENDYDKYIHNTLDEKVRLAWHQVTNTTANENLSSLLSDVKGVNVISPTWITMRDTKGGIKDLTSSSYVQLAHDNGIQVWVLADDFSSNDVGEKYVDKVLARTSSRNKLEDNLINAVKNCGADGINLDYEYISLANGDNYLQFLREMSIKCKENDLILSIDNYIPSEWSGYYDLEQQGRIADYVVVMSYDEHTAGSDTAGPVASLPFVKKAVEDTVALVGDATRVVMGVPFYTRIWDEIPEEMAEEGSKIIEDSINGNYALNSSAVSMDTAKERYEDAGVEPVWNDETGTNYVYIQNEAGNTQIWIENARSIQAKIDVAIENGVGGIACWKLGLETEDVWNVIEGFR